ncbi:hypothetical protein GWK47_015679 [Chionoecetes opilio]|uniref:Uncharacterized protein n=1 Tax=Chionoecetes opilio TaxID=41210 RepID=A0A8J4XSA7_CHIOP|nr:hypothetical protein GWK47_015679 [Chionoecetes opilio]
MYTLHGLEHANTYTQLWEAAVTRVEPLRGRKVPERICEVLEEKSPLIRGERTLELYLLEVLSRSRSRSASSSASEKAPRKPRDKEKKARKKSSSSDSSSSRR